VNRTGFRGGLGLHQTRCGSASGRGTALTVSENECIPMMKAASQFARPSRSRGLPCALADQHNRARTGERGGVNETPGRSGHGEQDTDDDAGHEVAHAVDLAEKPEAPTTDRRVQ